ncbi:hypothetical protein BMI91_19530 [Thioclava sediminum]|uniref:HTH cro/C1-type domain-containing protein n=1 Tax=Thioclava sediminum TaxID=1915319 RepID=A0ABX3MVI0_9RHOB|nr:helix-turn-helix transcriptional regulator [Thioclava sediminum]OOY22475.1 hypothetical protein BMI91_19530 [Thioclava sediminum]
MTKERKVVRTKGSAVHPSVGRGLSKLGVDLGFARRARQISTTDMAARMGVSRSTLHRLETGDPGVSLNTLAMALSVLGLFDRLTDLVDPASDEIGLLMSRKALPRRIARRHAKRPPADAVENPATHGSNDDEPEGW